MANNKKIEKIVLAIQKAKKPDDAHANVLFGSFCSSSLNDLFTPEEIKGMKEQFLLDEYLPKIIDLRLITHKNFKTKNVTQAVLKGFINTLFEKTRRKTDVSDQTRLINLSQFLNDNLNIPDVLLDEYKYTWLFLKSAFRLIGYAVGIAISLYQLANIVYDYKCNSISKSDVPLQISVLCVSIGVFLRELHLNNYRCSFEVLYNFIACIAIDAVVNFRDGETGKPAMIPSFAREWAKRKTSALLLKPLETTMTSYNGFIRNIQNKIVYFTGNGGHDLIEISGHSNDDGSGKYQSYFPQTEEEFMTWGFAGLQIFLPTIFFLYMNGLTGKSKFRSFLPLMLIGRGVYSVTRDYALVPMESVGENLKEDAVSMYQTAMDQSEYVGFSAIIQTLLFSYVEYWASSFLSKFLVSSDLSASELLIPKSDVLEKKRKDNEMLSCLRRNYLLDSDIILKYMKNDLGQQNIRSAYTASWIHGGKLTKQAFWTFFEEVAPSIKIFFELLGQRGSSVSEAPVVEVIAESQDMIDHLNKFDIKLMIKFKKMLWPDEHQQEFWMYDRKQFVVYKLSNVQIVAPVPPDENKKEDEEGVLKNGTDEQIEQYYRTAKTSVISSITTTLMGILSYKLNLRCNLG